MKPHILVPYDFSQAAERALAWATDYHRVAGGTLHVVHVVHAPPSPVVAMPRAGGASAEDIARSSLELAHVLRERHIDATHETLLSASASVAVLDAAVARKSTLIVMGTQGHGGLERLALGSLADYLVRNAPCPVLTMRAR